MTNIFNQNKLLTSSEVAKVLETKPSTISRWVYENKIPYVKFGTGKSALVRFNPHVLDKWIEGLSKMPVKKKQRIEISNLSSKKTAKGRVEDFNYFVDEIKEAM